MRPHDLPIVALCLALGLPASGCFELDFAEDASGGGGGTGCPPDEALVGSGIGAIGPALELRNGEGETERLWDRCGKVTLLGLGAGWCVTCREEMAELVAWHGELAAAGFDVFYALYQDDAGNPASSSFARGWKEEYGAPFAVLADPLDRVRTLYRLTELDLPLTVVLDRSMVVRLVEGNLDPHALRSQIDAQLAE